MLGDLIHKALKEVGVTEELVERFLGMECGCELRRQKLNELSMWAYRISLGKVERAVEYLNQLIGR